MEALLLTCGLLCVWPGLLFVAGIQLGRHWGKFKIQSPISFTEDKPRNGENIRRDKIGFGKDKDIK